jgi:hypothetical protein
VRETSRALLPYRRAEEIFEENTRLLANFSPHPYQDPGWWMFR